MNKIKWCLLFTILATLYACHSSKIVQEPFAVLVVIEGLTNGESASIQVLPATQIMAQKLSSSSVRLPQKSVSNGEFKIEIPGIPDGYYELRIEAPELYFRDPKSYLFRVEDQHILHKPNHRFVFNLIPPSQQVLPPCRLEANRTPQAAETQSMLVENEQGSVMPQTVIISCQAEGSIDVSAPQFQHEQP